MTAINAFVRDSGVHFITDGATYSNVDLSAVGRLDKVSTLPWLGAAMAVSGDAVAGYMLKSLIGDNPIETFDDLVMQLPAIVMGGCKHMRSLSQASLDDCEMVIGGWSESADEPRAYALATASHNGRSPFTLRPVTKYSRPFSAAMMSLVFEEGDAAGSGMKILEAQRNASSETTDGRRALRAVGAFGQHTHISRNGIEIRCIGRWPDRVGKQSNLATG